MATFEVSCRTTLTTATVAAALAAIRAPGSGGQRPTIQEIQILTTNAVAGGIGLCRSTALGTGALTSVTPVAREPSEPTAAGSVAVTAWATAAPTNGGIGTVFRRFTHGAVQGAGVVWPFSELRQLFVPLSSGATGELCFVNLNAATPALYDITVILAE